MPEGKQGRRERRPPRSCLPATTAAVATAAIATTTTATAAAGTTGLAGSFIHAQGARLNLVAIEFGDCLLSIGLCHFDEAETA